MNSFASPGETRFDTMTDFRRATDALLTGVQRELCVFDSDLKALELHSRARAERLSDFLLARRGNRLRIVVHDTGYIERHGARIMTLLRHFSHCMQIRRTPDELRELAECYALADSDSGVVRFHADHVRGKIFLNLPQQGQGWQGRFEELWEASQPGMSATHLGL